MELLVLADDFTGAHEAGALIAQAAVRCVLLARVGEAGQWEEEDHGPSALVVNTLTRHVPPEVAAAQLRALAQRARQQGVRYLFKKTDSTLRGATGAELGAVSAACDAPVLFLSAYPALGRTVKEGILYVDGQPLAESVFRRDARQPAVTSVVREALRATYEGEIREARGAKEWREWVAGKAGGVVVFDAETEEEVERVVEDWQEAGRLGLTAGPAGVLRHLLARWGLRKEQSPMWPRVERVLVVNGSLHPASRAQVETMVAAGIPRVVLGEPDVRKARCRESGTCILETPQQLQEGAEELLGHVAEAAKEWWERGAYDALLVFGGDTAMALLDAWGVRRLAPVGEAAPGVAASRAVWAGGEHLLVSKAGGFGNAGAGMEVLRRLRGK